MGDIALFEEGILDKKQGPLKQWRKYYCTLQNSKFSYRPFKGAEATSKDLEMSTVHSVRATRGKPGSSCNEIHFHLMGDKEMVFSAFNTDDQDRWVKVLQKAIELKRKRESLRSSLIDFERDRGITLYDQPWDLQATVNQSNEKLKESFKNPKSTTSLDSRDDLAKGNDSPVVRRRQAPYVEPYAEVVLFPKPKNHRNSEETLMTPYAETTINGSTLLAPSNERKDLTIYSKCTEMKPTFSENESCNYSYAQVIKPKFRREPDTSNIEKFRVSHGAYDSYVDGDSGQDERDLVESGMVSVSSNESGKESEAVLASLKDALVIFSTLAKYEKPRSLKYPDCEKSASFIALKKHIIAASSKDGKDRFTQPRSFKLGTYVQQLKKSVSGVKDSPTAVQVQMEMEL
ncbi:uncharacterized protein LOC135493142 [Lineus longissimus]|uniref:uncharacterized protein LOC135493142 n=1 Tax=Lineus longissimus TaxID=88925 RepID=UPI002B4EB547